MMTTNGVLVVVPCCSLLFLVPCQRADRIVARNHDRASESKASVANDGRPITRAEIVTATAAVFIGDLSFREPDVGGHTRRSNKTRTHLRPEALKASANCLTLSMDARSRCMTVYEDGSMFMSCAALLALAKSRHAMITW